MTSRLSVLLPLSLILLLACFALPSLGQTCAPLNDATCSPFIPLGTPIFVPGGSSLPLMQTIVNRFINGLNFLGFPEPCRSYALQLFCATWLRPCFQAGNVTLTVPQEPCLQGCTLYEQACKPLNKRPDLFGLGLYYPPGYSLPLNCSAPVLDSWANNVSFWPTSYNFLEVNATTNLTVPCSQPVAAKPPAAIYCQPPLVPASTSNGLKCAFECPLPSLTESQYDSAKVMQGIMGWTSWVCSALLFIALIVSPKARQFPRNLVIMTTIAANIAAGAIIMPTYATYDETWCGGSDVTVSPAIAIPSLDALGLPDFSFSLTESDLAIESSLCTFQGAMLQFGFLAAVLWWVIIAFNMCVELFFGKLLHLERPWWKWGRFALYMSVGWGVPFVLMVIPASAGRIKFVPAGTYCFITNEDNNAWSLTFWFLPVGISLLVGCILFIAAIVRITILMVTLKKIKRLCFLYMRLFIFVFLYLALFVFIFAYNIEVANNSDAIDSGYNDYYKCLVYGIPDCSLSDSVSNYDLVMLKGWSISSLGVLLFLIFMSIDILQFWYHLFVKTFVILFVRRRPRELIVIFRLVAYRSASKTLSHSATALTVTQMAGGDDEGEGGKTTEGDEEEKREDDVEDASSSSSEE